MAVKFSSIKANLKTEAEGDWQDIPDMPGVSLCVRGVNYGPYTQARDQVLQRLARKYGRKGAPSDVVAEEFGRIYAAHLLIDWKGFADDEDKPLPYSAGRALEGLTDPAMRELRSAVEWAASQVGQADVEVVAEVGEPSAPASSGT